MNLDKLLLGIWKLLRIRNCRKTLFCLPIKMIECSINYALAHCYYASPVYWLMPYSPGWHYWEVVAMLGGRACGRSPSTGWALRNSDPSLSSLCLPADVRRAQLPPPMGPTLLNSWHPAHGHSWLFQIPSLIWQPATSKCKKVRKDEGKGGDFPNTLPSLFRHSLRVPEHLHCKTVHLAHTETSLPVSDS